MKELDNNNAVVVENADYDIDKTYLYCGFAPDAETASIWYDNTAREGRDFPFAMLPTVVHDIIINWHAKLGYQPLYTVAAMLAAASVALGNRIKVQIGPKWKMSPALWIMSVGNPGTGKSSPTNTVFEQILNYDKQLREVFSNEVKEWQANKCKGPTPKLRQVILSDFTPESLWKEHGNNPTGIVVLVDEIKGMFDSVDRYNPGQLVSQLLSAYTGNAIKITRKGENLPTIIEDSCIGIYGTIQPSLLFKSMKKTLIENGFFDRWLIMWPDYTKCPEWSERMYRSHNDPDVKSSLGNWSLIMQNLLELGHKSKQCTTVPLSHEAFELLRDRNNNLRESVYDPDADIALEQREFKLGITVGKLALVMEMINAAVMGCESVLEVSKHSMQAAIAVYDWFEARTVELLKMRGSQQRKVEDNKSRLDDLNSLLDRVPLQFKRSEIIEIAQRELRMSRTSVDRVLSFGIAKGLIARLNEAKRSGVFEKTDLYIETKLAQVAED